MTETKSPKIDKIKAGALSLPLVDGYRGQRRIFELLITDPWLCRKCDRQRRLRDKWQYITDHCWHEVAEMEGLVLDIGPGPGEFLEICREFGHNVLGVDAVTGTGGMGDNYLEYSRLRTAQQRLLVDYCSLAGFLFGSAKTSRQSLTGKFCLINSQGSIEQSLSEYMIGPPHSEHHDCMQLEWDLRDYGLYVCLRTMVAEFRKLLCPGGLFLIYANGSKNHNHFVRQLRAEVKPFRDLEFWASEKDNRIIKIRKK